MPKEPNLSRLPPRDECLARIALANTPRYRLPFDLSAVVGPTDGTAIIFVSDRSGDGEPELSCGSSSSAGPWGSERDV